MNITRDDIFAYHAHGKVGVSCTSPLKSVRDLSIAYTPGVAEPVKAIADDPTLARTLTAKGNLVAVVTDGTAILGLGDRGPSASIPVMEGKAVLFKVFGDVDGWPVPLDFCRIDGKQTGKTDPQRIIDAVCAIAPMYGGINLEDIAAPACFEIEDTLDEKLDIPVFHDDQWGTAVITLAGVENYCRLCERDISELRVVVNGAGAAGIRITDMLKDAGCRSVILCDSRGVIRSDRTDLNAMKAKHAVDTTATTLRDALKDAHVFVGVSVADCLQPADLEAMASYPAIFAMANPVPEILPDVAAAAMGERPFVMATGRSDFANQVNNVLGFPFLFRGALDVQARTINMEMKRAAASALARVARMPVTDFVRSCYDGQEFTFGPGYIIPKPFDERLFVEVSFAVAEAAVISGAAPAQDLAAVRSAMEKRDEIRQRG
jgi:malate dehydrogenase (oxaloacetate-decarboxylating)(NADP+)